MVEYKTPDLNYSEVYVLYVHFKTDPELQKKLKAVARLLHRVIPYPVILVMQQHHKIAISLADKWVNATHGGLDIDQIYHSQWLRLTQSDGVERAFLADFTLRNMTCHNFYQLYQGLISKLMSLQLSRSSGVYRYKEDKDACADAVQLRFAEKKKLMQQLEQLQRNLSQLKRKLKAEKQLAHKVDLNIEIHTLKNKIKQIHQVII